MPDNSSENFPAAGPGGEPLRVATVAPPWFEVPPRAYGGIEWLCYWLVDGLIDRGHDVTLIAAGPNHTRARFFQTFAEPPSRRLGEPLLELVHAATAGQILREIDVDIVHDHSFAGPLLAFGRRVPTVISAHGPVDGELADYYRNLKGQVSLVAISDAQRALAPDLDWVGTVHNAVPTEDYPFETSKEDFVLFLGRMGPEKAPHIAIDACRAAGYRMILAGKCNERQEQEYFVDEIEPRLGDDVEWIGQTDSDDKKKLLSRARCLIFPIQWEEPFGIVMVEAMACGTPVVALRGGSTPEVVADGVTGFVCDDPTELPDAIKAVDSIDPHACREHAQSHFGVDTMVEGYEAIYRKLAL